MEKLSSLSQALNSVLDAFGFLLSINFVILMPIFVEENQPRITMPLMEGKVVIEKTGDGETKNFLNSFSGFLQCIGWIPLGFFCGGKSAQNHYGSYGGEGCNREDGRWRNYKLSSVSQ